MRVLIKKIPGAKKYCILKRAIESDERKPYTRLRFYNNPEKLNQYYYALFFGARKAEIFVATINGEYAGALVFIVSKWDSRNFGIKMANLGYFAAIGGYSEAIVVKDNLLHEVLKYSKSLSVKFLSVRVEADDASSIHALENNGFKTMDNLVTYIYRDLHVKKQEELFPKTENWFTVSSASKEDLAAAGDLLVDRYKTGHYSFDPGIPVSKREKMYREWLKSKFREPKYNDVFIAKRLGRVVGCSIFSVNTTLERYTGLKSLHKGLGVVDLSSAGCAIALFNAQRKKRKDFDFAEFETQGYNYSMLSVAQRLGMQLICSRQTFHRSLG
jgi:type IV secretory pathway TrbD component